MLLNIGYNSLAQGSFSATLEPAVIGKDETAELKLVIENAQQAQLLAVPSLKNFTIVSGPNQESGMESINGNVKRYVGYSYILKPKSTGDFVIGAASARVDGKTLQSRPLRIKVINATTGNSPPATNPFAGLSPFDEPATTNTYNDFILKKGEKIADKINKNIFIKVETDKTSCYLGEPIVVSYKLYTRLKSESSVIKSPAFNGFSVVDLLPTSGENYTIEKLNGRMYNVYLLRKVQLYPLQSGSDTLEMASVENKINFVKAEYLNNNSSADFFSGFLQSSLPPEAFQTEKVTLQSRPVAIMVKPLPDGDSINSFHGAVGDFSINAAADKTNFTTSDAGRLQVTITGAGNLTLINPPEIKWPQGIEVFEPETKENLNKRTVPVTGTKTYTYPFTIDSPSHYTLPPLVFTFFDLATQRYKTLQTQEIKLTIAKGARVKNLPGVNDNRDDNEKFFDRIFTNRWMLIIPVAVLILGGLFFWLQVDNKKEENKPAVKLNKEQTEEKIEPAAPKKVTSTYPFEQSEKLLLQNEPRHFYQTLNKELLLLLISKLSLSGDADKRTIWQAIDKSSMAFGDGIAVKQLMDDIEMQLYTPFADEHLQSFYERALGIAAILRAL